MEEGWLYTTVVLGEALLHFFCTTERLLGHKLHPLIAYVLGVLGMMVPFTFWLVGQESSATVTAWVLWKTVISAGLSVVMSYGVDAMINKFWNDKHKIELLEARVKANEQSE